MSIDLFLSAFFTHYFEFMTQNFKACVHSCKVVFQLQQAAVFTEKAQISTMFTTYSAVNSGQAELETSF